jgi:predicted NBD/HSP70 family sugar kinase
MDDFTLVVLDLGIRAARYQAGELLVGEHGIGAEFGHTKIVAEAGRPCHCGAKGCLQAYVSISGIVEQVCELANEPPPPFAEMEGRFARLAERARSGDAALIALLDRSGRYLGRALANHVNMQDPAKILVLTRAGGFAELIASSAFAALREDVLPLLHTPDKVQFRKIDEWRVAQGAAAMLLEQLYLSPPQKGSARSG